MDLLQRQAAPKCFCNSAFFALGVTMSWDDGFLGARASRPHKAWHSLDHLPHLDQPGTAPWLSFGLADAVLAHRVAACSIALKLSGGQRDSMRAGRPRSRGCRPDGEVGGIRRATSQKADLRPLGNSQLPASPAPAPHDGADHTRVKQVLFQASRAPALAGGSFESETTGPNTYREQGPCLVNSVGCIIEHRYTG